MRLRRKTWILVMTASFILLRPAEERLGFDVNRKPDDSNELDWKQMLESAESYHPEDPQISDIDTPSEVIEEITLENGTKTYLKTQKKRKWSSYKRLKEESDDPILDWEKSGLNESSTEDKSNSESDSQIWKDRVDTFMQSLVQNDTMPGGIPTVWEERPMPVETTDVESDSGPKDRLSRVFLAGSRTKRREIHRRRIANGEYDGEIKSVGSSTTQTISDDDIHYYYYGPHARRLTPAEKEKYHPKAYRQYKEFASHPVYLAVRKATKKKMKLTSIEERKQRLEEKTRILEAIEKGRQRKIKKKKKKKIGGLKEQREREILSLKDIIERDEEEIEKAKEQKKKEAEIHVNSDEEYYEAARLSGIPIRTDEFKELQRNVYKWAGKLGVLNHIRSTGGFQVLPLPKIVDVVRRQWEEYEGKERKSVEDITPAESGSGDAPSHYEQVQSPRNVLSPQPNMAEGGQDMKIVSLNNSPSPERARQKYVRKRYGSAIFVSLDPIPELSPMMSDMSDADMRLGIEDPGPLYRNGKTRSTLVRRWAGDHTTTHIFEHLRERERMELAEERKLSPPEVVQKSEKPKEKQEDLEVESDLCSQPLDLFHHKITPIKFY